jgi:hypothetical protein
MKILFVSFIYGKCNCILCYVGYKIITNISTVSLNGKSKEGISLTFQLAICKITIRYRVVRSGLIMKEQ